MSLILKVIFFGVVGFIVGVSSPSSATDEVRYFFGFVVSVVTMLICYCKHNYDTQRKKEAAMQESRRQHDEARREAQRRQEEQEERKRERKASYERSLYTWLSIFFAHVDDARKTCNFSPLRHRSAGVYVHKYSNMLTLSAGYYNYSSMEKYYRNYGSIPDIHMSADYESFSLNATITKDTAISLYDIEKAIQNEARRHGFIIQSSYVHDDHPTQGDPNTVGVNISFVD